MRKLLLLAATLLLTGGATLKAQSDALTLTFDRQGTEKEDVTVNVAGIDNVTAELTSITVDNSQSNNKNGSGTLAPTGGSLDASILCPNGNGNKYLSATLTFTIEGLTEDFVFNTVGLDIHALNATGGYQDNLGASTPRRWNVDVDINNNDFVTYDDIEVAYGVERENGTKTHKVWDERGAETKGTSPLTITLTITSGSANQGCFFGLSSITLSNVPPVNVTYHLQYNGNDVATEEAESPIGAEPAMPASFARDYCTFAYQDGEGQPVTEITAETNDIYVVATVNKAELPFTFSESYENATWYYLAVNPYNNGKEPFYAYTSGDELKAEKEASTNLVVAESKDAAMWAFIGNPVEGVKVVNKATEGKSVTADFSANSNKAAMGTATEPLFIRVAPNKLTGYSTFLISSSPNATTGSIYLNAQSGGLVSWNVNGTGSTCWVFGQADVTMHVNGSANWATFIAPFKVTVPEGVMAYTATGVDEESEKVQLTPVKNATILPHTPVILYSESGIDATCTGPDAATVATSTEGLLTGVYADTKAPVDTYVLQKHGENVGFYKVDGTIPTVGPNRAYLTLPTPTESEVKAFFLGSDDATGIQAVADAQSEDGAVYNLAGQRVAKTVKGIYVVGGKKVAVK